MREKEIETQIAQLPEEQVEFIAEIFKDPADIEMMIHDISVELDSIMGPASEGVNSNDFELTKKFSNSFYMINAIQDIAKSELRHREQDHKEMLRESPEYSDAMTFIKYASNEQYIDWDWISDKIVDQSTPEIANLAIKDFKEDNK